jgi:hypothetical protein
MTLLWIFFMYIHLALHRWNVWCYLHRSTQHLFTQQNFLHALYNNMICLTPSKSTLHCVSSDSRSKAYATLQPVRYAQTVTLPAEIQHAPCLLENRKQTEPLLRNFGRPMLWMLYFHSTMLGCIWTRSTPWSATCHIFFLRTDNQFANKNFREIFVRHFATTQRVYKKCV